MEPNQGGLHDTSSKHEEGNYYFVDCNIQNLNVSNIGSESSMKKDPSPVIRMRQPISHMKETESFRSILGDVEKKGKVILHCCGVPGSGKSQIVRKLAKKFPFSTDESQDSKHNAIKWHIQCKDSGHDVLQEMKELTKQLQKNGHMTKDKYQSIDDDLSAGSTESLVQILLDCSFPVLIIVEDPDETSFILLSDLFRCLQTCERDRKKIHVYITSRTKMSILSANEIKAMEESGIYKEKTVSGFEEKEAVDYLLEDHEEMDRGALVQIFNHFSGLPLGLQAAKGYCENAMIDYTDYLELVEDIQYEIIDQEKEEIEKEYGNSAHHVFQAMILPFTPNDDSDVIAMLYWKILSCLSYFNYDRIPRSAIDYCCHKLRTVSVKRSDIVDKADVGRLINKLVDHHMCSLTDETEVTFHEVISNSFRLIQNSFLEPSFHPLKMAIEIMSGLVTKDMRKMERCQKMYKLRRHLQTLLKYAEKDQDLYKGEDSIMLKALTSHLYETAAAIMLNESPALFLEESDEYFRKALSYVWEGEDLTIANDKPDETAKKIVEKLSSKAENLPMDFAVNYASKLESSLDKREVDFFRKKSQSKEYFEKIPQLFNSKACKKEIIGKLQECQLFLSDEKYRQIFYLERVASILHSWSRHVLFKESKKAQSDKRSLWLSRLCNSIAVECRVKFGVTLVLERLSLTSGLVPIVIKQKLNLDDNCLKSLDFCKKLLSEKEDATDMYENGMLKEVYGPSYPYTRITLLRHIVRINARLIKTDGTIVKEADQYCDELFSLAVENASKIYNSCLSIIYCAKYHASKGDFDKSMQCFRKFFDVAESNTDSKPRRYNTQCWAVYNYARAVCCQPTSETCRDALGKIQQVLDEPEVMNKAIRMFLEQRKKELEDFNSLI